MINLNIIEDLLLEVSVYHPIINFQEKEQVETLLWICEQKGYSNLIPVIKKSLLIEVGAGEEAKKKGLVHLGRGYYGKEKGQAATHKTEDGKLITIQAEPATASAPSMDDVEAGLPTSLKPSTAQSPVQRKSPDEEEKPEDKAKGEHDTAVEDPEKVLNDPQASMRSKAVARSQQAKNSVTQTDAPTKDSDAKGEFKSNPELEPKTDEKGNVVGTKIPAEVAENPDPEFVGKVATKMDEFGEKVIAEEERAQQNVIDQMKKEGKLPQDFKAVGGREMGFGFKHPALKDNPELQKELADRIKKENKPPHWNLCQVSIPGTNKFCDENIGIPRDKMPQLGGKPKPGSAGEAKAKKVAEEKVKKKMGIPPDQPVPDDRKAEYDDLYSKENISHVNVEQEFEDELKAQGIAVSPPVEVPAASLKATQSELVGEQVVGMVDALEEDPNNPFITAPIMVTKDGYVIDGHHRWAAIQAYNMKHAAPNGSKRPIAMKVRIVDEDIMTHIPRANAFAEKMGIETMSGKAKGGAETTTQKSSEKTDTSPTSYPTSVKPKEEPKVKTDKIGAKAKTQGGKILYHIGGGYYSDSPGGVAKYIRTESVVEKAITTDSLIWWNLLFEEEIKASIEGGKEGTFKLIDKGERDAATIQAKKYSNQVQQGVGPKLGSSPETPEIDKTQKTDTGSNIKKEEPIRTRVVKNFLKKKLDDAIPKDVRGFSATDFKTVPGEISVPSKKFSGFYHRGGGYYSQSEDGPVTHILKKLVESVNENKKSLLVEVEKADLVPISDLGLNPSQIAAVTKVKNTAEKKIKELPSPKDEKTKKRFRAKTKTALVSSLKLKKSDVVKKAEQEKKDLELKIKKWKKGGMKGPKPKKGPKGVGLGSPESRAGESAIVYGCTKIHELVKAGKSYPEARALIEKQLMKFVGTDTYLTKSWVKSALNSLDHIEKEIGFGNVEEFGWDTPEGRALVGSQGHGTSADMFIRTKDGKRIGVSLKKDLKVFVFNGGFTEMSENLKERGFNLSDTSSPEYYVQRRTEEFEKGKTDLLNNKEATCDAWNNIKKKPENTFDPLDKRVTYILGKTGKKSLKSVSCDDFLNNIATDTSGNGMKLLSQFYQNPEVVKITQAYKNLRALDRELTDSISNDFNNPENEKIVKSLVRDETHISDILFSDNPNLDELKVVYGTDPAIEMKKENLIKLFGVDKLYAEYENETDPTKKQALKEQIEAEIDSKIKVSTKGGVMSIAINVTDSEGKESSIPLFEAKIRTRGIGAAPSFEMSQNTFGGLSFKYGTSNFNEWDEKDRSTVVNSMVGDLQEEFGEDLDALDERTIQEIQLRIKELEKISPNNTSLIEFKNILFEKLKNNRNKQKTQKLKELFKGLPKNVKERIANRLKERNDEMNAKVEKLKELVRTRIRK